MGLTGALSSPDINEHPKPSKGCQRSFTLQNQNSTSLPNLWTTEKLPDCDDPYSSALVLQQPRKIGDKYTKVENIYNKSVRMYAETDLDEPTDYGSRFDEGLYCDTDSDDDSSAVHVGTISDTVKTYCTEDTPYETPFNFSTSTSMSDLRQIEDKTTRLSLDIDENNKLIVVIEKRRVVRRGGGGVVIVELEDDVVGNDLETAGEIIIEESLPQIGSENIGNISVKSSSSNRSHNSSKPIPIPIVGNITSNNNSNNECLTTTPPKPEYNSNSGLMSPEKPVEYCEEGTPAYPLSRVDSYGALNLIGTAPEPAATVAEPLESDEDIKAKEEDGEIEGGKVKLEVDVEEEKKDDVENIVAIEKECSDGDTKSQATTIEVTKVVKFEEVVNYVEETPLMFSRSSSLTSLGSIEGVQQFCDDRSSLISDLSRMTSGLISPSELPDSPTQTVPPSPKSGKRRLHFPTDNTNNELKLPSNQPLIAAATNDVTKSTTTTTNKLAQPPTTVTSGVFEDNVTKFKVEHTPIEFSRATSLSDLTVDDREEHHQQQQRCAAAAAVAKSKLMVPDDAQGQIKDHNEPVAADSSKENQDSIVISSKAKEEEVEEEEQHEDKKENINAEDVDEDNESFLFGDDEDDEDENLLAACINSGIQSFRNGQSRQVSTTISTSGCGPATVLPSSDPVALLNPIKYHQSPAADATAEEPSLIGPSSPHRLLLLSRQNSSQNVYEQKQQSSKNGCGSNMDKESSVAVVPDDNSMTANVVSSVSIPVSQSQQLPVAKTEAAAGTGGGDCLKTYCTEDTPAILSHAGSHSDLSLLSVSVQATQPISRQELDDTNVSRHNETATEAETEDGQEEEHRESGSRSRRSSTASVSSISSFGSDGSYENARALLQQCIRVGMSKNTTAVSSSSSPSPATPVKSQSRSRHNEAPNSEPDGAVAAKVQVQELCENDLEDGHDGNNGEFCDRMMEPHRLTDADLTLLQQCILEGMRKSAAAAAKANFTAATAATAERFPEDNSSVYSESAADLTEADQALLRQCIEQGMPHKAAGNVSGFSKRRSRSAAPTRSTNEDMDENDKMLLRQCIRQGMPKKTNGRQKQQQHEPGYSSSTVYLRPISPAAVPFSAGNVAGSSSRKPSKSRDRNKIDNNRGQQLLEPPRPGHACCIHCPRMQQQLKQAPNKPQPSSSHLQKMRRKSKSAATAAAAGHFVGNRSGYSFPPLVRDSSGKVSGEINLYYVASQILSMKKEFFDRSHVWV